MIVRNWTAEQMNAVHAHGGSILVSAAAGSGKTAVLVERVITMLSLIHISLEEAKSSVIDHIEKVRQTAQDEVYANGYDYQVNAEIVNMYFTTRQYETFTLPAGMYDAVRITIGEAKGHNWWCVLYPPLCLPAAQPEEEIEQALTEEEADLVTRNPQYEVRFAVVEWFEDLKNALNW